MTPQNLSLYAFVAVIAIVLLFAFAVLWKIYTGEIRLTALLAEPLALNEPPTTIPKASLSRFQFLIFTFVVAGLFLLLSIEAGTFVQIPTNVLFLLGISGGTSVVSKAVGKGTDIKGGDDPQGAGPKPPAPKPPVP